MQNNGTDEKIPISNIQSMSNSLNNMQQRYNLIPSQNLKNMNYSTRNTNTYQKYSSIMLRQIKTKKKEKRKIKERKEEIGKDIFTILKNKNIEKEDSNLIENCLISHFFMKTLNKQARDAVIQEMSLVEVKKINIYLNKEI